MKKISTFLTAILVFGFLFLALPEKGYSGTGIPPIDFVGCCQYYNSDTNEFNCAETPSLNGCPMPIGDNPNEFLGFLIDSSCNNETDLCSGFVVERDVPTLSEWGLIAMAGVLGIIGFMVIRRRKVVT